MISFIIPAYNEEKSIGLCIISIHDEAKKHGEHEIIVVDNGSTDRTVEHVSRPWFQERRVRIVHEPQKGVVRARQRGYEEAKGWLVANIDADNILPEGWLDNALWEFKETNNLVLLSGPIVYYDFSTFLQIVATIFYWVGGLANRLISPMCQGGNTIMLKSALDKIGGYNTNIEFYGDDTDFAKSMGKVGRVKFSSAMWVYGSARRFKVEGVVLTTFRYILNYFSVSLFNKPVHKEYKDIRL